MGKWVPDFCMEDPMVYLIDASLLLTLLTLVAGSALFMLSGKEDLAGRGWGKFVGIITILASLGVLACLSYYTFTYWRAGYFEYPHGMMMMKGKGGMMNCPMMDQHLKMKQEDMGRERMGEHMHEHRMDSSEGESPSQ